MLKYALRHADLYKRALLANVRMDRSERLGRVRSDTPALPLPGYVEHGLPE